MPAPAERGGAPQVNLPGRPVEQFSAAALQRSSRQLAEGLGTSSQVRLGQVLGRTPEAGTPGARAE